MSIKVYRDNAANSIFIEDANGAQFLNSLQAVVESGLVSIEDLAKGYQIVSGVNHTDFVDENDEFFIVEPEFPFNEGAIPFRVTHCPSAFIKKL